MKLTINTTEVQVGDKVVGFQTKVVQVDVARSKWGAAVTVTFENGEEWRTSGQFVTTVIR